MFRYIFYVFVFGSHTVVFRPYSWLCAQKLVLKGSGDYMYCWEINLGLLSSRQVSLPAVLLLWPKYIYITFI